MAINSPRPTSVITLAVRRAMFQAQAATATGGGGSSDAATLQGHPAAYFAPAAHTHPYAPAALPAYVVGSEPSPDVTWSGKLIMVTDAGNPTLVKVCIVNSAGGYEWITVAQSS